MFQPKVLSTGLYVPEKILTNVELEKMVETNDQWIRERTGIAERRIASREREEFPSNMALWASQRAIASAQIDPEEIDLILFATCTPDYPLPNTASVLQTKLGLQNKCGAIDISAACSGFVYGFNFASSLIQTGLNKTVLVVGSEMLSPEIDWEDRGTCILFGDGCGVAILTRAPEGDQSTFYSGVLGADGTGKDFFHKIWGGAVHRMNHEILDSKEVFMKMQGQEMFKVAVRTLAKNAQEVMDRAQLTADQIDWLVPHQANIRIIEATAKTLGFPMEKVVINIEKYGNTSAATVPMAFHEAIEEGRIKRGDVVLFDAFGAGLTSAASLFKY